MQFVIYKIGEQGVSRQSIFTVEQARQHAQAYSNTNISSHIRQNSVLFDSDHYHISRIPAMYKIESEKDKSKYSFITFLTKKKKKIKHFHDIIL